MAAKQRITVLDVARLAGVSQGSVSRVITGKNWVSDELRQRVEAAVKELGYQPNPLAQGLKSQRSRAIAALVSDISNPLHGNFLAGAEEILQSQGYLLFVSSTHNDAQRELELIRAYGSGRVDGLIVAHSDERNRPINRVLKTIGLPIIFHDRDARGLGDTVIVDHAEGARIATRHLVALGHKRIAILTPPTTIRPGRERLIGYRAALEEANIKPNESFISTLDASDERAYEVTRELLQSSRHRPTALICLGTRMLAGVLEACETAKLRIPEDISLIGIGDTDLIRLHKPPITSVKWDITACGRQAASMLLKRLAQADSGESSPLNSFLFPVKLVDRGSCAKAPKS